MRARIFDYGAGNLHSLRKALERVGATVDIGSSLGSAELLVLPGVGAFGAAAARLAPQREAIREAAAAGLPVVGICLGMQLLADRSEEGPGSGLGLISGQVRRLRARTVPHMGWNRVEGRDAGTFYFANGYAVEPADTTLVTGWADHEGDRFAAAIRCGTVTGFQFHPEKSGAAGLALLASSLETLS